VHQTAHHGIGDNFDTMFRTRFKNEIVAEFLPPTRKMMKQRLIILCDGMPSIPRKQSLAEFLAGKGFWVTYPRYRGAWESGGEFMARSPHEDILDVLNELPTELEDIAFGRRFRLAPDQVFVIGGSFGGAAAILLSLDPRVKRVVANCPLVDWSILDEAEKRRLPKRIMRAISVKRLAMGIGLRQLIAKVEASDG
jgi:pimeloyl-ACP methyl ester carboxylesterase